MLEQDYECFDDIIEVLFVELMLTLISNTSDGDCTASPSQNSFHNPET
jgi:hypothetical protein